MSGKRQCGRNDPTGGLILGLKSAAVAGSTPARAPQIKFRRRYRYGGAIVAVIAILPAAAAAQSVSSDRIEAIEQQIRGRQQLQVEEQSGSWTLRECYGAFTTPKNSSIRPLAGTIPP